MHRRWAAPPPRLARAVLLAFALAALAVACGSPTQPCTTCGGGTGPPPGDLGPWIFAGAGDIGWCNKPGAAGTAQLVQALPGTTTIFTAGDNAYPHGEKADFDQCYAPHWGPFLNRTRPAPGNHEYETAGAGPYFNYFGANAGPSGLGYYSFYVGQWLVLSLNSEDDTRLGSPQLTWLSGELAGKPASCTIAIWHKPLFTSGPNGENTKMRDTWRMLYDAGADIVINGHDHLYERFAPQDFKGSADPLKGMRQFTVGTGGADLYDRAINESNSEVLIKSYGILKLTLTPGAYQWEFIPVPGGGGGDSGSGTCH